MRARRRPYQKVWSHWLEGRGRREVGRRDGTRDEDRETAGEDPPSDASQSSPESRRESRAAYLSILSAVVRNSENRLRGLRFDGRCTLRRIGAIG